MISLKSVKLLIVVFLSLFASMVFAAECNEIKVNEILARADSVKQSVVVNCSFKAPTNSVITKRLVFSGSASSNLTFDCNDSKIEPLFPGQNAVQVSSIKKVISNSSTWLRPENLNIKNCTIIGAVRIFGMDKNANGLADEYKKSSKLPGHTRRAQVAAPKSIVIDNCRIQGQGRTPLYLAPGVTYSGAKNSVILGTFNSVSIYFDAESSNNFLINNKVTSVSTPGNDEKKRELIAIDGSSKNEIRGNYFSGLNYGGIYLYRNCGEGGTVRHQTPNSNIISNNTFYYKNYTGEKPSVWLGSRNGNSKYCDDDKGFPFGSSINNGDFAEGNQVSNNTIYKFEPNSMIIGSRTTNRVESNIEKVD